MILVLSSVSLQYLHNADIVMRFFYVLSVPISDFLAIFAIQLRNHSQSAINKGIGKDYLVV